MKLQELLFTINQQLAARLASADLDGIGESQLSNLNYWPLNPNGTTGERPIDIQCGCDLLCNTSTLLEIVNWHLAPESPLEDDTQFLKIMEMEIEL